jgi:monoamine oxidase
MAKGPATRRLQHALRQAQAARGPVSAPRLSRRRILGCALAAGTLGLAPRLALGRVGDPRIAIIGAGIAGLNAAWQFRKNGLEATVYEARGRVGGRMLSRVGLVEPGIVDDLGGSFVNTDHIDLRALLKEFDHSLYDRRTDPRRLDVRKTAWFTIIARSMRPRSPTAYGSSRTRSWPMPSASTPTSTGSHRSSII